MGYVFPNVNEFPVENADNLFVAITKDVGGSGGGESRIALVHQGINSPKRTCFQLNTRALDASGIRATKLFQRSAAGVFQYLQNPTIWGKFQTTSQLIEASMNAFDNNYGWNGNGQIGRPQRAAGQPTPGLRNLWCYFIHHYFQTIEANAGFWAGFAKQALQNDPMAAGNEGQNWINTAMDPTNGIISARKMVFPHSGPQTLGPGIVMQSSYYGA